MPHIPCFDKATRTDCPQRALGCRSSCPKWAAYAAEKEVEQARAKVERKRANDLIEYGMKTSQRIRREYCG